MFRIPPNDQTHPPMTDHPEFLVKLRAPIDATDQAGTRRLRAALKRLWRGYGLRAVEIRRAGLDTTSRTKTEAESTEPPETAALAAIAPRPEVAIVAMNVATGPQNDTRMSGRKTA